MANWKSSGKRSAARGYMSLYECLMVTSATPAMSPISVKTHTTAKHTVDFSFWINLSLSPKTNLSPRVSVSVPALRSDRQHPSYGDCLEVKREYYQNSSVLDCVTQCSQSAAHLCEQFLQVKQIGFVTLGPFCCA